MAQGGFYSRWPNGPWPVIILIQWSCVWRQSGPFCAAGFHFCSNAPSLAGFLAKQRDAAALQRVQWFMELIKGIGVSVGVVVCRAMVLGEDELRVGRRTIAASDVPEERRRLQTALSASSDEIRELRDSTTRSLGKETGAIFDFHLGLLNDPQLLKTFLFGIETNLSSAEYAVHKALRDYGRIFLSHEDAFFRERVKDIYDIERRLLDKLMGKERIRLNDISEPVVIVAHDLSPSQTASLNKSLVHGIAIEAGGRTSHTAIIANSLGIPAVVGLENVAHRTTTGDMMVVNGYSGLVILDPDQATINDHKEYERRQKLYQSSLEVMRDLPARTRDGIDIALYGNIEFPSEVENAIAKGATGIGLYRTEFLYLSSDHEPTEDDHYAAYAEAIRRLGGRPVVIRTLDLGADKYSPFLEQLPEANPFLGCRSIRLCLANEKMFMTQLRAILRASVLGNVSLMFPMISAPIELHKAKMILKDVMEELDEEGLPFNRYIRVGMMVEVPSTALVPHPYMSECDFFSIGTNDLIQYTLAVDRGNQRVASLYSGAHPAVLSLIQNVVRAAGRKGKPVSLCGELGGDPQFTLLLIGMGIRNFSITPQNIPEIKKIIRSVTIKDAEKIARTAMSKFTANQISSYLHDATRKFLPDIFSEENPAAARPA